MRCWSGSERSNTTTNQGGETHFLCPEACMNEPRGIGSNGVLLVLNSPRCAYLLQPFSPQFLAAVLPIFSLPLVPRAVVAAKLLPGPLNLKEFPALSICTNCNITRTEKFAPEYRVKKRSDSIPNTAVKFNRIGIDHTPKGVQQFANHYATIKAAGQERIGKGGT